MRSQILFTKATLILSLIFLKGIVAIAQSSSVYKAIYSGTPWFDDRGKVVSAHGANIIKHKGKYYLFGEAHTDTSNVFVGFNCYSSTDLCNWKFESIALPAQLNGKLGPNRVGERPKVMKCPATGEYVMYMHVDTLGYTDQFVGYAISKNITGPYIFKGPLLFDGKPILKWDMGAFQDRDGAGYVLLHGGDIYKLAKDFKSISDQVNKSFAPGFESPAIFRKGNIYYFLGSNLTSWEKNDNYYYTSTSLSGPWTAGGLFCPKVTLTWNSQTTFVLPIEGTKDTTYMFMGDRWSYPKQASAATYVWQPFTISGTALSIPNYQQAWAVNLSTGISSTVEVGTSLIDNTDKKQIKYLGNWQPLTADDSTMSSNEKGAGFLVQFNGQQIGLVGLLQPQGGYARIEVRDNKERVVLSTLIDTYCKYKIKGLLFITPKMPKGTYSLALTVSGEHGVWTDKRKRIYGSTNNYFSLGKVLINK